MPDIISDNRSASGISDRKAVFFCPNCGREEPVDGDWIILHVSNGDTYVCPACLTVILVQPQI